MKLFFFFHNQFALFLSFFAEFSRTVFLQFRQSFVIDVEKLEAQFSQYLAKTGQMLTGGLIAETAYFFRQFRQSWRRHDVGKLAVKCSQFLV